MAPDGLLRGLIVTAILAAGLVAACAGPPPPPVPARALVGAQPAPPTPAGAAPAAIPAGAEPAPTPVGAAPAAMPAGAEPAGAPVPTLAGANAGPLAPAASGGEASVASYRLGPGDQVRMTVFRHEDLSGEFEVDGEGFFAMPLVGEIMSAGLTARALESEIEARLKAGGYLLNPQVSIEVLNYRPFYIIGEVNSPGSYQYVNGMTVINAVALAGGFTYRADHGDITISRGGASGPQIEVDPSAPVLPGDIIEVAERFF